MPPKTTEHTATEESPSHNDDQSVETPAAPDLAGPQHQPQPPTVFSHYWERVQAGSQIGLFVLALLVVAHTARSILQPLVVATLLYFLLHPVVRRLIGFGLPRPLSAILIVSSLVGSIGWVGYELSAPALEWADQAPRTLRNIGRQLRAIKGPAQSVSEVAKEAEKITEVEDQPSNRQVTIQPPGLAESVWAGLRSFLLGAGLTVALLLFLLVYGQRLVERLLLLLLPRMRQEASNDIPLAIERRVSAYLGAFCLENTGLALAASLMFWLEGMPSPVLWGVLGGTLNFIPYLGAVTTSGIVGLVAYTTFNDIWPALTVAGSYMALTAIEGVLIQPIVLGRRLALNPLVMLIAVALGAWLWGIVGALVAVPMLVVIEAICYRVPVLKPIAGLLS